MNSMTGFGRGKLEKNDREYIVEIKAVNHRYCDINIKMPRNLSYLEEKMRKEILGKITRGKVDVFVSFLDHGIEGKEVLINDKMAKLYIKNLKALAKETEINEEIQITEILKLPDILTVKQCEDENDILWQELKECTSIALNEFLQMRETEGNKIKEDLKVRIEKVEENIYKIIGLSTGLIEDYIVKLEDRIKELLKTDIQDKARIAQEIVIYADKCSIEEELTRLKSHIKQLKNMLEEKSAIGKKMDFLIQEINRETNTIGSKSVKLEITDLVVDTKTRNRRH